MNAGGAVMYCIENLRKYIRNRKNVGLEVNAGKKKQEAYKSFKQDRQCTYNVTLRRVRAIIVAVDKQYVLCILSVCL
jgi:hypothetical protein